MENEVRKLFTHSKRPELTAETLWFQEDNETLPEIVDRLGPTGEGWDFSAASVKEVTRGGRRGIEMK